jgi:alpha-beta hydrolase superfamily lysophospholipase
VVYLHCNIGDRRDVLPLRDKLLSAGFSLVCFDFGACGHSTGTYLSGGLREQEELATVLSYVCDHFPSFVSRETTPWYLWGHSLGAATALLYVAAAASNSSRSPPRVHVSAVILDSPYTSLLEMSQNIIHNVKTNVLPYAPAFMLQAAAKWIRRSAESEAGFEFHRVRMLSHEACHVCAFNNQDNETRVHRDVVYIGTCDDPATEDRCHIIIG